jgi:hypothetical protein
MNIKKQITKFYKSPAFPLVVFTLLMMIAHFFMRMNYGDDVMYQEVVDEKDFWELMKYAYEYNKTIFIRYYYGVLYYFLRKVWDARLWRPFLACCYTVTVFAIPHAFTTAMKSKEILRRDYITTACLLMLVPLYLMNETGWLSTSNVYTVPVAVVLVGCIGIKRAYFGNVKWYDYIIWLPILWLGCAHEQIAPLVTGMCLLLLAYSIKQKKLNVLQFLVIIPPVVQSIRAFTFSGNESRRNYEAETFFPDYFSLDIIDKCYLAYIETMKVMMSEYYILFLVFTILLCVLVWKKYSEKLYRFIASIPMVYVLIYGVKLPILSNLTPYSSSITFASLVNGNTFNNINPYVGIFVSLMALLFITLSIYLIMGNTFKSLFYIFLLWGGLFTRFIMGMSASLYASGHRTFYILFICILIISLSLYNELRDNLSQKGKSTLEVIALLLGCIGYIDFLTYI